MENYVPSELLAPTLYSNHISTLINQQWLQPVPMIFSSLLFNGNFSYSSLDPFWDHFSSQPINRQSCISQFLSMKASIFLQWFSLGFGTLGPALLTSAIVHCLRSASIVFVVVSPFDLWSQFSKQSFLPHVPFPTNRRPQRYDQHYC